MLNRWRENNFQECGGGHLNGIRSLISILISEGLYGGSSSYLELCCPGGVVVDDDDHLDSPRRWLCWSAVRLTICRREHSSWCPAARCLLVLWCDPSFVTETHFIGGGKEGKGIFR